MKKSKKSRVSWPSDSMLCQVKMFQTEDCPAKVANQTSSKPKASNLPPGFEVTERPNISLIPRIKWKRPPKYILNDALLVASGEESTETLCENLRIAKVLEAFYPHRSVIPSRPSVSPAVEDESYDDRKTPNISLTPIENEHEAVAADSSHNSKSPAAVFGLGPDLSLAASAALSALMKTKEQGSLIDADLLVKLLSDPNIIKKLMNDTTAKPIERGNNTLNADTTKPGPVPPQHVMDRNPFSVQPGNGVPHIVPASVQSSVCVATQPVSSALSMNQKPPLFLHTYPSSSLKPSPVDDVVVSEQKEKAAPTSLNIPTSSSWNMNRVLESAPTGTDVPNGAHPMNINQDDEVSAKQPVKNLDYFKNLIREHGGVTPATNETNNHKARVDNNMRLVKVKFQKPCMFFGKARGCKFGESCLYLHDDRCSKRLRADVAAPVFPRAKRLKF